MNPLHYGIPESPSFPFFDRKEQIYRYLIEGLSQAQVARKLKVSRQYISQVTKELEEAGLIYQMNRGGIPKRYGATGRKYESVKQHQQGITSALCRVHLIACRANIIKPPRQPVKWVKTWTLPNGTKYYLRDELLDIGRVTFEMIEGKENSLLIIYMPEKYMDAEELKEYIPRLETYAQRAANWFMKKYECQLGLLELNQKPHFAFSESNEIAAIAEKETISWGDFWIDNSEGHPEWETTDRDLAIAKAEAPKRILQLEDRVSVLEQDLNRIIGMMESLENKLGMLLNVPATPPPPSDSIEVI